MSWIDIVGLVCLAGGVVFTAWGYIGSRRFIQRNGEGPIRMSTVALRFDNPRIVSSTDTSAHGINRMRVTFTNGWSASIIRGHGTYGEEEDLFEVCAIDPAGVLRADHIFGWMTETEVMQAVDALSRLDQDSKEIEGT